MAKVTYDEDNGRPIVHLNCPRCQAVETVEVMIVRDPGIRTFNNGDPGYPPSDEISNIDACKNCGADNIGDDNADEYTLLLDRAIDVMEEEYAEQMAEYDRMMEEWAEEEADAIREMASDVEPFWPDEDLEREIFDDPALHNGDPWKSQG